jgi:glutathione reductase (NADPH)
MPQFDLDLFVIGGGSGGVRAARVAATAGARVAIAEEYRFGGTCVIRGCIPKKMMVYAAHYRHDFADAVGYGWTPGTPRFDWRTLIANKDNEIERLSKIYARLLDDAGVRRIAGRARLTGPHEVAVSDQRFTAGVILIATGGHPFIPAVPGAQHAITSNELVQLPALPPRCVVVGGGYVAVEFASILAGLGSRVSQVYRGPTLLRGFDRDIQSSVTANTRANGVELVLEAEVTAIEKTGSELRVQLSSGATLPVEAVLFATGRRPNTQRLGLEELGVTLTATGAVAVDEYSRSRVPHIYAVGDVTDRLNLTPVAIRDGQAFVDTVFRNRPTPVDHALVPTAVFAIPTAATVGLTEDQARREYPHVDVYRSNYRSLKHTLTERGQRSMMKMVVDRETNRVLGVHMVGDGADEIVQSLTVALRMGATKADFDAATALHPTSAEEFVLMRNPVERAS